MKYVNVYGVNVECYSFTNTVLHKKYLVTCTWAAEVGRRVSIILLGGTVIPHPLKIQVGVKNQYI